MRSSSKPWISGKRKRRRGEGKRKKRWRKKGRKEKEGLRREEEDKKEKDEEGEEEEEEKKKEGKNKKRGRRGERGVIDSCTFTMTGSFVVTQQIPLAQDQEALGVTVPSTAVLLGTSRLGETQVATAFLCSWILVRRKSNLWACHPDTRIMAFKSPLGVTNLTSLCLGCLKRPVGSTGLPTKTSGAWV